MRCEAPHPAQPDRTCLIGEGRHADHQDRDGAWPNPEVQEEMRIRRDQKIRKKGSKRSTALAGVVAAIASGKAAGQQAAATSTTSTDFRVTFMSLMVDLATRQQTVSTNDVWAEWRARGWPEPESAQAAGIAGRTLAAIGVLERTEDIVDNTSANGHSEDRRVVVWRSLIVGASPAEYLRKIEKEYA